jgi:hypothetical protein
VASTSGGTTLRAPGLEVTAATPADWAEIRRRLVAVGQTASLAAEDLCSAPDLSEAGDAFREMGLERRREALVARRGGRLAGFALLEFSSMGLNFSELTNAFRLHAFDPDPEVTAVLAARARDRYGEAGRANAIGLVERLEPGPWAAAGFAHLKSYSCWTVHRSVMRRYVEFLQRLYEHLPARALRPQA